MRITLENAIRKLTDVGVTVVACDHGVRVRFVAVHNGHHITIHQQQGMVSFVSVRDIDDRDEWLSDYFAGTSSFESIAQVITYISSPAKAVATQ